MSNSSNHSDIKFGIQSNAERYCWAAYFIFGVLSSLIGDTLILVASSHKGAFKINRILVTIIQHIAVSDLANTIVFLLSSTVSLLANSWNHSLLCKGLHCIYHISSRYVSDCLSHYSQVPDTQISYQSSNLDH